MDIIGICETVVSILISAVIYHSFNNLKSFIKGADFEAFKFRGSVLYLIRIYRGCSFRFQIKIALPTWSLYYPYRYEPFDTSLPGYGGVFWNCFFGGSISKGKATRNILETMRRYEQNDEGYNYAVAMFKGCRENLYLRWPKWLWFLNKPFVCAVEKRMRREFP